MLTQNPIRKTHLDALAITTLLLCCVYWGAQQVLMKALLPEIPAVMQTALRFIAASIFLAIMMRWRGLPLLNKDSSLRWGWVAGGLFALEFLMISVALNYTSASRLTIFLYTSPFVVALVLPWFVPAERMGRLQWLGLLCAFVAIYLVFSTRSNGLASHDTQGWGDALALLAGVAWGLTTVVIRSSNLVTIPAEKLLFYQVFASALLLTPLSLANGDDWLVVLRSASLLAVLGISVQMVCAFASYLAWMWMLSRYPATKMSSFVFLSPVFAVLFGGLWLGEPVTAGLVGALVLVGAGIFLVNRK